MSLTLLSTLALESLVESALVRPVPGSLLWAMKAPFRSDPAARAAAGAEVRRHPVLMNAAGILAHATTVIELAEVKRGAGPVAFRLYAHGDRVCAVTARPDGLSVEAPTSLKQLVDRLTTRLASGLEADQGTEHVAVLPSEVTLLAHAWPARGVELSQPQPAADVVAALEAAGAAKGAAQVAVEALVATKLLRPVKAGLAVDPAMAPALRAVWSGQVAELRAGSLDGSGTSALAFAGHDQERWLLQRSPPEVWRQTPHGRGIESDEDLVILMRHSRAELRRLIAAVLGPRE